MIARTAGGIATVLPRGPRLQQIVRNDCSAAMRITAIALRHALRVRRRFGAAMPDMPDISTGMGTA